MTVSTPPVGIPLEYLPDVRFFDGRPLPDDPWRYGPFAHRQRSLNTLPSRVRTVFLAECIRVTMTIQSPISRPADSEYLLVDNAIRCAVRAALTAETEDFNRVSDAIDRIKSWTQHHPNSHSRSPHLQASILMSMQEALTCTWCGEQANKMGLKSGLAAFWAWSEQMFQDAEPGRWKPHWNSSTVVALARGIFQRRDLGAMPILADALEEADCDSPETLEELRKPNRVFSLSCRWLCHPLGLHKNH